MPQETTDFPITRRSVLQTASCGFGYLAFAGLCARARASESGYRSPLAPKAPHFEGPAKRVIFLFMQGGPSHVDTFDYKPVLQKSADKGTKPGKLLPSPWEFKPHGKSRLRISTLFPEISKHADKLCLINGMHTDNPAHPQATIMMHTGSINFVRPSVGAWTVYGLGSNNQDLPGFITINPPPRLGGAQNYGSAFLPACFQGTRIGGAGRKSSGGSLPNLSNANLDPVAQRRQFDLIQTMNRDLRDRSGVNHEIDGIIESYELAFRMQKAVPDVMDIQNEKAGTLESYGIGKGQATDAFGRQCLMARRFAEAGVRYIQITHGGWDQHKNLKSRLTSNCGATDRPIASA